MIIVIIVQNYSQNEPFLNKTKTKLNMSHLVLMLNSEKRLLFH